MDTAMLKRVPPKPVGALLLHLPNSFFSKIVPYSLDDSTGSLAYSRPMPLAVPRRVLITNGLLPGRME